MRPKDDEYREAVRRTYGRNAVDAVTSLGTGIPYVNQWANVHRTNGGAFVEATIWVPDDVAVRKSDDAS